jgi:hypothetical protein
LDGPSLIASPENDGIDGRAEAARDRGDELDGLLRERITPRAAYALQYVVCTKVAMHEPQRQGDGSFTVRPTIDGAAITFMAVRSRTVLECLTLRAALNIGM